jgi:FKBP-type peptidyl-prolyl cis-trans isomerase
MHKILAAFAVVLSLTGCVAANTEAPKLETDDQKTLYALGFQLSRSLGGAAFTEAELALIQQGLTDGALARKAQVDLKVYGPMLNALMADRVGKATEAEKQAGQAYCDEMAKAEGAQKTAAGAIYVETQKGTGAQPTAADTVTLHYHGTLRDGTVFDSSVDRGTPATFALAGVIPCFREGLEKMSVGGKAKLVCPANTAYGDRGSPPNIKPGAALTFEVELLGIAGSE